MQERIAARRSSVDERADECAAIVNNNDDAWVVWCHLNSEADALKARIPMLSKCAGRTTTTPTAHADGICGQVDPRADHQAVNRRIRYELAALCLMAFVGVSDSWEQYYQAVRRCWRFGQTRPVSVHVIAADTEGPSLPTFNAKTRKPMKWRANW